jgi:anti-anti-sigma regulatory factor
MPLLSIPVTVPYQLVGDPEASLFTVQVDAAATAPNAALATAQVLVEAHARMRHPGRGARVLVERARIGAAGQVIPGFYAYALVNGFHITRFDFPARLESDAAQHLADAFEGMDDRNLFGLVADCVHLQYVSSIALATLAGNAQRLRLRLLRPSEQVVKVIAMVGLQRMIKVHADLPRALDDLVADYLRVAATKIG